MRTKLSLISCLLVIAFFLGSCQSETINGDGTDIKGIWSFTTNKGHYGELWLNDDQLMNIRMPRPRPAVFNYRQVGDTVKLYIQKISSKGSTPMDQFYIVSREGDKVKILQDGNENELTLIKSSAPKFEKTPLFEQKVLGDFNSRATQKK